MPVTPGRPSPSQRRLADSHQLAALLRELDIRPPTDPTYHLVSRWAAKHVWRIDADGRPWAYVRYLLGSATHFPDRWRHLRLGQLLNEGRIGPRILGMSPDSHVLGGRAVIVEAALLPISREDLEARAAEAMALLARLHDYQPLFDALADELNDVDLGAFRPLVSYMVETRERWAAVTHRWLEYDLPHLDDLILIVEAVLDRLGEAGDANQPVGMIVPAHQDVNHGNFMVNRQGALRLIDFEELSLNHPVADLGIFLTWYVDQAEHRSILAHYPLLDPDEVLDRMRVWVPLRYLNIAAHWSARLARAEERHAWLHAVERIDEWMRGACELVFDGFVPGEFEGRLRQLGAALLDLAPAA